MRFILFFCFMLFVQFIAKAVDRSYFTADFQLKESVLGKASLYKGKLSYELKSNTLLYKITFPKEELWIFRNDSFFCVNKKEVLVVAQKMQDEGPLRLFRLMVMNKLNDFGISEWPYRFLKYSTSGGNLIRIYAPKLPAKKWPLGEIHLGYKDKLLSAVVMFDSEHRKILLKTFFSDYKRFSDLWIPTSIIQEASSNFGKQFRNYRLSKISFARLLTTDWERLWNLKVQKIGK